MEEQQSNFPPISTSQVAIVAESNRTHEPTRNDGMLPRLNSEIPLGGACDHPFQPAPNGQITSEFCHTVGKYAACPVRHRLL